MPGHRELPYKLRPIVKQMTDTLKGNKGRPNTLVFNSLQDGRQGLVLNKDGNFTGLALVCINYWRRTILVVDSATDKVKKMVSRAHGQSFLVDLTGHYLRIPVVQRFPIMCGQSDVVLLCYRPFKSVLDFSVNLKCKRECPAEGASSGAVEKQK